MGLRHELKKEILKIFELLRRVEGSPILSREVGRGMSILVNSLRHLIGVQFPQSHARKVQASNSP